MDPLKKFSTYVPQTERIPGREDQVKNSAGGYVWQLDEWQRLRRFLILGTEGGSYYASEKELTRSNALNVIELARQDGARVVEEVMTVSLGNLAPKQNATLFTLAVCTSRGLPLDVRRAAFRAIPVVCRTGTMLFQFVTYARQFRGWGRGLRNAVANWYTQQETGKLALQVVKYRQRHGWTHRDLLRVSHPETSDLQRDAIFQWITHRYVVTGESGGEWMDRLPNVIHAFESAQHIANTTYLVDLIHRQGLPWEALPDHALQHPEVWEALVPHMGMTALIRNLGKMSSIGALTPGSSFERLVLKRLEVKRLEVPTPQNEKFVGQFLSKNANPWVQARVHPFSVLLALTTYQAGRGVRGSLAWNPTSAVVDALDAGFYAAFGGLEPSGKRTMIALDVSGSMDWASIANSHITPRTAAAAMALVTMKTEGSNAFPMAFSHELVPINLSPRQRLDDVVRVMNSVRMGGTDCSLPMQYARRNRLEIDTFVVYTDNETWAGGQHPSLALNDYRQVMGIDARLVVVGMVSNEFTIADPQDGGMMDVVGFDSSAPQVIADFSARKI